jgi:GntR family transcriptional repressor for pyruvate dehydrogenase complex
MNHPNEPPINPGDSVAPLVQRAPANPVFQILKEDLHQRIRRGDWRPGDRLPSIVQLAKDLAASTGSVREALRSLQSLGLVQIAHGRGVFVTAAQSSPTLARNFHNAARESLVELAEVRRIVEPELAALAAERGTDTQLNDIARLASQMEVQARPGRAFAEPAELDDHIHCCIALAACNPTLSRMIEQITALSQERRALTFMAPSTAAREVHYHQLIAEALCDRNAAQARLLMLSHMHDVLGNTLAIEEMI